MHRRFRVSNFQSTTKVRPFCTTMPIGLSSGWNQIQFNLADFTRRAYGKKAIKHFLPEGGTMQKQFAHEQFGLMMAI